MLTVIVPPIELYDSKNNEFISSREHTLVLEHSLVSISKWESKWKIPFLSNETKTVEQTTSYIECMTINKNVSKEAYRNLSQENLKDIKNYIDDEMTATVIHSKAGGGNKEIITAELVYYWMTALTIPFECDKWHFNKLMTLINIANIKNSPPKKMSKAETLRRNKELNDARRRAANSKG